VAQLFIRKNIEVSAPVEVLWKVLTDSEFIRQYMFGCNAETDWKSGSPCYGEALSTASFT
jgi:uncharacterized protein YndB with AHSA1/START domain